MAPDLYASRPIDPRGKAWKAIARLWGKAMDTRGYNFASSQLCRAMHGATMRELHERAKARRIAR